MTLRELVDRIFNKNNITLLKEENEIGEFSSTKL